MYKKFLLLIPLISTNAFLYSPLSLIKRVKTPIVLYNNENNRETNSTNIHFGHIAESKLSPIGNSTLWERDLSKRTPLSIDKMINYVTEIVKMFDMNKEKETLENLIDESLELDKDAILEILKSKLESSDMLASKSEIDAIKQRYKDNPELFKFTNYTNNFVILDSTNRLKLKKMLKYLISGKINQLHMNEIIEFMKYCNIDSNTVVVYKKDENFIYCIVGMIRNRKYIVKGIIRNYLMDETINFLDIKDRLETFVKSDKTIDDIDYSFLMNTIFKRYVYQISFLENDN